MKRLPGIYRDIHPDREPVNFGRIGGRVRVYDIDSKLMAYCRQIAEQRGESFKRVLRKIMLIGLEVIEREGGSL